MPKKGGKKGKKKVEPWESIARERYVTIEASLRTFASLPAPLRPCGFVGAAGPQ